MGTNLRTSWAMMLGLALTVLLAQAGFAAPCETPESTDVYVFLPFLGEERDGRALMVNEMVAEGYTHNPATMCFVDTNDNDNNPEGCTILAIRMTLESGGNLWLNTHGANVSLSIESYKDMAVRDQRFTTLLPVYGAFIVKEDTSTGRYTIAVNHIGTLTWSASKKQIYFLGACWSEEMFNWFHGGLLLGYTDEIYPEDIEHDADILFKNMSGRRHSGTKRPSGVALVDCPTDNYTDNFASGGDIETTMVLAPAVVDWAPKDGACMDCDHRGYVEFDCTMDTTKEDVVSAWGCTDVDNMLWESDHKVTFDLIPGGTGPGVFHAIPVNAVSANNTAIRLDGNMIPGGGTNGVAPNGDPFQWVVDCSCEGPTVTIADLAAGECPNWDDAVCSSTLPPNSVYCIDLNAPSTPNAGDCAWTYGSGTGDLLFQLYCDDGWWYVHITGAQWPGGARHTCAKWRTAVDDTGCPPTGTYEWVESCCNADEAECSVSYP